jgi:hypothetical protein
MKPRNEYVRRLDVLLDRGVVPEELANTEAAAKNLRREHASRCQRQAGSSVAVVCVRPGAAGVAALLKWSAFEVIHEAGNVAALEWRDPLGLRGCGFFTVDGGLITFQRGYWDKLSFLKMHGLPIE